MIADSKFLPLNPWTIRFADDPGINLPGLQYAQTRTGQLVDVQHVNSLAFNWPVDAVNYPGTDALGHDDLTGGPGSDTLTGIQRQWFIKLYQGGPPAVDSAPDGWAASDTQRDLWNKVVLPACANCHMALKPQRAGSCGGSCGLNQTKPFTVSSYDDFVNFDAHGAICKKEFHMPHAAPTQEWFWSKLTAPNLIKIRRPTVSSSPPFKWYTTPRAALFGAILQQESQCCGPNTSCSVTNVAGQCDCPLDVPLHPDRVEKPLGFGQYDGDGCAETEFYTPPGGNVSLSRLNFEPSDNYCGLTTDVPGTSGTKGSNGMICDNSLVPQGICVPGCRLADPRTGVINLAVPSRGCPKQFECLTDNKCHVCGSIGAAICTTGQVDSGAPCPFSGTPSGGQCV
jgi:hypothetical protein